MVLPTFATCTVVKLAFLLCLRRVPYSFGGMAAARLEGSGVVSRERQVGSEGRVGSPCHAAIGETALSRFSPANRQTTQKTWMILVIPTVFVGFHTLTRELAIPREKERLPQNRQGLLHPPARGRGTRGCVWRARAR